MYLRDVSDGARFCAALEVTLAAAAVAVMLVRSDGAGRLRAARAVRSFVPAALGFAALAGGGGALLAEAYEPTDPWPFVAVGLIAAVVALATIGGRSAQAPGDTATTRIVWRVAPPLTVVAAVFLALATAFPVYLDSLLAHRWP